MKTKLDITDFLYIPADKSNLQIFSNKFIPAFLPGILTLVDIIIV
jgi:hypothetical protein